MKKLTKIQASAKGEECTVHLTGCRNDTETTVLAHWTKAVVNSARRHDLRAAYSCDFCHGCLDGRIPYQFQLFERAATWADAIAWTHVRLMQKGLIKVDGYEPGLPKLLKRR